MQRLKKSFNFILIILFMIIFLVQLLLLNDDIKTKISAIYNMEAQYVYSEQDLKKGTIEIETTMCSNDIFILQNGERICAFDKNVIMVDVYDNSVIEIDGTGFDNSFNVKINNLSDNIDGFYEESIVVDKNIVILGRFFVK